MNKLSTFLDLLKEPLKILSQNGKLMAITTIIYLMINSISYILYTSSTNPIMVDFALKIFALLSARPGTPEYTKILAAIREDIGKFLGIEAAYMLFYFFVIVFSQTTVIIIASSYYNRNNLSLNELIYKVSRTWTRPFVTSFYVQLLTLGYTSSFILPFLIPSLVLYDHPTILITLLVFLAILFVTFNLYLSVVWSLAIVVSVFEDTYGLSALGKARELVKGKRLEGFLLNFFFIVVVLAILVVGFKLSPLVPIVVGMIEVILIGVVSMFQFMSYSVFYSQCKNEMKNSGGLEYSQIPTAPVLDEDLP